MSSFPARSPSLDAIRFRPYGFWIPLRLLFVLTHVAPCHRLQVAFEDEWLAVALYSEFNGLES